VVKRTGSWTSVRILGRARTRPKSPGDSGRDPPSFTAYEHEAREPCAYANNSWVLGNIVHLEFNELLKSRVNLTFFVLPSGWVNLRSSQSLGDFKNLKVAKEAFGKYIRNQ